MSGTILDKNMFSQMNGLNPEQTVFYEIDSPFPIKNRPIFYLKVGKMSYNCKEDTFQRQKEWINKILKKHKNEKGVIHTTNYEISQWVQNDIMNERLIFHNNENREEMLQKHIMSDKPTVIVSPSLITGVDFKDDISRFAIILKIPYPSLNSNKIKARQKTRPAWYSWKTICDLCQSYGRSIRSVDDYANTYILDANLSTVLKYNFSMIPKFVSRAIKIMKI
jgi:Rad3-related DNA helicase